MFGIIILSCAEGEWDWFWRTTVLHFLTRQTGWGRSVGSGSLHSPVPPPLVPPTKKKEALVVCKSSWVIFLLYFRETQISEIQIQVFINNNLFISLVLMDNDTYNLYESFMLDYLLSGSTP